jgi:hypothetical protein
MLIETRQIPLEILFKIAPAGAGIAACERALSRMQGKPRHEHVVR